MIEIKKADFKWDSEYNSELTLHAIDFKVTHGQKIAVIGDVGSGKSSFLAAILRQIRLVGLGEVRVCGSVS